MVPSPGPPRWQLIIRQGRLGARQIAKPLGHQADAGARRGGHHPFAGRCAAVDHVDRRDLRFGLQHDHARGFPRFEFHQRLHHLRLGRDRVAEISVATVTDRRMGDHFVAFHQFYLFLCHSLLDFLTINRDDAVRANHRTRSAAYAGVGICHPGHGVALAVHLSRHAQHIARTRSDAHSASFAAFLIDNDCSFYFSHKP